MKILAFHDAKGTLSALISQPAAMPRGTVAPVMGELMTEVEAPDVTIDPGDANSLSKLVDLVEHYRVEVKTQAKLSRKDTKAS